MEWYVRQGVTERGPMSLEELHRDYRDGSVSGDTLVKSDHIPEWSLLKTTDAADALGIRVEATEHEKRGQVKPFGPRLGLFRTAVGLFVGVHIIAILINIIVIFAIDTSTGYVEEAFLNTPTGTIIFTIVDFIPVASSVSFIISAVTYSIFFHHALFNVRQMNAPEATMKPFEAWVWHFVPIASFWKPLEAIRQIWDASHRLAADSEAPGGLLGIWWTTWIVSLLGNRFMTMYYENMTDPTSLPVALIVESIITAIFATSAICLWVMSSRVADLHRKIADGGQAEVF